MPHLLRDRRLLQDNQPPEIIDGYLVNDTFTTDRSAGAVNDTYAEPGPGRRTVVDGNSKLSLSSGNAAFATGGVGNGNPALWYAPLARQPGRLVIAQASNSAGNLEIGFDDGQAGGMYDSVRLTNSLSVRHNSLNVVAVGAASFSTTYQVAVVCRATGAFFFIKGGIYSNWTLIWISGLSTYNPLYPGFGTVGTTLVGSVGYLRVPTTLWLPQPTASDGFSSWGTTNGAGHAEGIAGGLGSGGSGSSWSVVGTWGVAGGVASASALSSGSAIAYANAGKADVIASVKVTRSAGDAGLLLRFADSNNFVSCRHDGTNVVLIKRVAGVDTTVQTTATTYVAGAELRVIAAGSAFRVYYNDSLVGSEQTIADAALQSPTNHGLYTTSTANTVDDFSVFARGSGGEYAALDVY